MVKKSIHVVLLIVTWHLCIVAASADEPNPSDSLAELIQRAGEVKIEAYSKDEYSAAATTYHELLKELEALDLADYSYRILGSKMGATRLAVDIPKLVAHYQQGRLKLDQLISARYPLDQINQAIADVSRPETLRNVIVF